MDTHFRNADLSSPTLQGKIQLPISCPLTVHFYINFFPIQENLSQVIMSLIHVIKFLNKPCAALV